MYENVIFTSLVRWGGVTHLISRLENYLHFVKPEVTHGKKFSLLLDLTTNFRIQICSLSCLALHTGSELFHW